MPWKATLYASDSQNPAAFPTPPFHPIFAVHDSLTGHWYELDSEMWIDVALQGDDEPEDPESEAMPS
ncbi:MAG TPA: hypothetical protein VHV32_19525 [Candidatus Angelobacter sp.]|jgi:hypothetical protein|nr:hypothetical protein [Candidatus Angelobacter sp.]